MIRALSTMKSITPVTNLLNCFKGDQGLRKVVGECGMKCRYIWLSSATIFRIFTNCRLEWNSTFAESGTQELFPSIRLCQLVKPGTSSLRHTEGSSSSAEYDDWQVYVAGSIYIHFQEQARIMGLEVHDIWLGLILVVVV